MELRSSEFESRSASNKLSVPRIKKIHHLIFFRRTRHLSL